MGTVTKLFDFSTGAQGWTYPADGYAGYFNGTHLPPNVLGVEYSSISGSGSFVSDNFIWDGFWTDLGVPVGSVVTQIGLTSVKREVTTLSSGGIVDSGPITLHYSGNNSPIDTFVFNRTSSTVDSSWDISSGNTINVPLNIQLYNSPVELQIFNNSFLGSPGTNKNYYDDITFSISYIDGVSGSGNLVSQHPSLSGSGNFSMPTFTGSGNLSKSALFSGYGSVSGTGYMSGNMPLFISGTLPFSGSNTITLYEYGNGYEQEDIPLFINGIAHYTNDLLNTIPLIVTGYNPISNNISLYVSGPNLISNTIPLFIAAPVPTTNYLNLFIKTDPIPILSGSLPLNIYGALVGGTTPGWVGSIPLYMGTSLPPSANLNLFISGIRSAAPSAASLNLSILCDYSRAFGSIPLIIYNQQENISRLLPLYIKGLGVNSGYQPQNANLNLVTTGFGSGRYTSPLDLQANINLIINGFYPLPFNIMPYNIVTLFLKAPDSSPADASASLFVSGAIPNSIDNNMTLFMKVLFNGTIPLYVHGF